MGSVTNQLQFGRPHAPRGLTYTRAARSYAAPIAGISDAHSEPSFSRTQTPDLPQLPPPYRAGAKLDLEAQAGLDDEKSHARPLAAEYAVQTRTKLVYLAGYFALNLVLTIYNKAVLGGFAFPWLLTALHCGFVSVGCYGLLRRGHFVLTNLKSNQHLVLIAFSLLFTLNIAISNVSLHAVSVPFHQIMRSTTPAIAIFIYRFYFHRKYSASTYLTMIPIIFGVGLATYGDIYFTPSGFLLTFLGVVLAAVKTIVSNRMMTGSLALPAYEILFRMSPLAALQSLLFSWMTGELGRFSSAYSTGDVPPLMTMALTGNGFIAFVLNISSFQTNKLAGALTITVAGNLKQCLTILLGIVLFKVHVGLFNGLGMMITLLGAAWYSKVELDSKGRRS